MLILLLLLAQHVVLTTNRDYTYLPTSFIIVG